MKLREAVQEHMISHLLDLCKQELELDDVPPIKLLNEPSLSGGGKKSFGVFDGHRIVVATKNRHPMDVARTLAHELTHWKQRTTGMAMSGEDGSEAENGANAIAGIILRKFGEKYPDYFIDSLP